MPSYWQILGFIAIFSGMALLFAGIVAFGYVEYYYDSWWLVRYSYRELAVPLAIVGIVLIAVGIFYIRQHYHGQHQGMKKPERIQRFCPFCGVNLIIDVKFCPNCGKKLE